MRTDCTELVKPKAALKEDYTENSNEKDERATGHLINGDRCVQKADIH